MGACVDTSLLLVLPESAAVRGEGTKGRGPPPDGMAARIRSPAHTRAESDVWRGGHRGVRGARGQRLGARLTGYGREGGAGVEGVALLRTTMFPATGANVAGYMDPPQIFLCIKIISLPVASF
eukprot:gene11073-biopygen6338